MQKRNVIRPKLQSLQNACQELVKAKENVRLAEASLRFYLTGSPAEEPMDLSYSDLSDKSDSGLDLSVEILNKSNDDNVERVDKNVDVKNPDAKAVVGVDAAKAVDVAKTLDAEGKKCG